MKENGSDCDPGNRNRPNQANDAPTLPTDKQNAVNDRKRTGDHDKDSRDIQTQHHISGGAVDCHHVVHKTHGQHQQCRNGKEQAQPKRLVRPSCTPKQKNGKHKEDHCTHKMGQAAHWIVKATD